MGETLRQAAERDFGFDPAEKRGPDGKWIGGGVSDALKKGAKRGARGVRLPRIGKKAAREADQANKDARTRRLDDPGRL